MTHGSSAFPPRVVFLVVALTTAACDLFTKGLVDRWLVVGETRSLEPWPLSLSKTDRVNQGGLLGAGNAGGGRTNLALSLFNLAVCLAIFFAVFLRRGLTDWILIVALALVLGGAVGNLYDRVVLGGVRDFLRWDATPLVGTIFNLADVALFVGAGLYLLQACQRPATAHAAPSTPEQQP